MNTCIYCKKKIQPGQTHRCEKTGQTYGASVDDWTTNMANPMNPLSPFNPIFHQPAADSSPPSVDYSPPTAEFDSGGYSGVDTSFDSGSSSGGGGDF